MTHIFNVRQLEHENNSNKATNPLDYGKPETWEEFIRKQSYKKNA